MNFSGSNSHFGKNSDLPLKQGPKYIKRKKYKTICYLNMQIAQKKEMTRS